MLRLLFFTCSVPLSALFPAAAMAAPAPAPSAKESAAATPQTPKAPEPIAVSVTRAVGEVGQRFVTSREVRISEAIGQVFNLPVSDDGKVELKPIKVMATTDPSFPSQVMRTLDEWTVYLESTEIEAKTADKNEVAKWIKTVGDALKGSNDWEKIEPSATEIREMVERKLVVQAFERLKGNASLINVSDAEALQYYKKNRLRFGNLPFENFRDNIKESLKKTQTERRLADWRSVLRRKYRVRNFLGA